MSEIQGNIIAYSPDEKVLKAMLDKFDSNRVIEIEEDKYHIDGLSLDTITSIYTHTNEYAYTGQLLDNLNSEFSP
jgi:hypothetical protein